MPEPADIEPTKYKTSTIIGLVVLIIVLIGLGYFAQLTYSYYIGVKSGTVDLERFAQANSTSNVETVQQIGSVDNTYVNNFADDPSIGPESAVLTIVAFEDFECPFCGQLFPIFRSIINKYQTTIRFVYRDFPISSIHPNAQKAAEAGMCAHAQDQFWAYHDMLYTHQSALSVNDLKQYARTLQLNSVEFDKCLDSGIFAEEVQNDYQDGIRAGVTGTPTLFFNGNRVSGVLTQPGFESIIDYFID